MSENVIAPALPRESPLARAALLIAVTAVLCALAYACDLSLLRAVNGLQGRWTASTAR